ncbi:MAG: response regulator [Candidatus Lambdaproteobacteria bacterium]|nr:response regulator [Candidatus Lambdaproteobacteria bacterium]
MGKTILVLEENSIIHGLVASALDLDGLTIHHEFNPENYVARAQALNPDLILVSNADQRSGYAVCRQLKSGPAGTRRPLVLLADSKDALTPAALREIAVDGVLRKPFEASDLQQQVSKHLNMADLIGAGYEFRKSQALGEEHPNPLERMDVLDDDILSLLHEEEAAGPGSTPVPEVDFSRELRAEALNTAAPPPQGEPPTLVMDEAMLEEAIRGEGAFELVPPGPAAAAPPADEAGFPPGFGGFQPIDLSELAEPAPPGAEPEVEELGPADLLEEEPPEETALAPAEFDQPLGPGSAGPERREAAPPLDQVEVELLELDADFEGLDEELQAGEIGMFESDLAMGPVNAPGQPAAEPEATTGEMPAPRSMDANLGPVDMPPAIRRLMELKPAFTMPPEQRAQHLARVQPALRAEQPAGFRPLEPPGAPPAPEPFPAEDDDIARMAEEIQALDEIDLQGRVFGEETATAPADPFASVEFDEDELAAAAADTPRWDAEADELSPVELGSGELDEDEILTAIEAEPGDSAEARATGEEAVAVEDEAELAELDHAELLDVEDTAVEKDEDLTLEADEESALLSSLGRDDFSETTFDFQPATPAPGRTIQATQATRAAPAAEPALPPEAPAETGPDTLDMESLELETQDELRELEQGYAGITAQPEGEAANRLAEGAREAVERMHEPAAEAGDVARLSWEVEEPPYEDETAARILRDTDVSPFLREPGLEEPGDLASMSFLEEADEAGPDLWEALEKLDTHDERDDEAWALESETLALDEPRAASGPAPAAVPPRPRAPAASAAPEHPAREAMARGETEGEADARLREQMEALMAEEESAAAEEGPMIELSDEEREAFSGALDATFGPVDEMDQPPESDRAQPERSPLAGKDIPLESEAVVFLEEPDAAEIIAHVEAEPIHEDDAERTIGSHVLDSFEAEFAALRAEIETNPEGERVDDLLKQEGVRVAIDQIPFEIPQHENTFTRAMGITEVPGMAAAQAATRSPGAGAAPAAQRAEGARTGGDGAAEPEAIELPRPARAAGLLEDDLRARLGAVLDELITLSLRKAVQEEMPRVLERLMKEHPRA